MTAQASSGKSPRPAALPVILENIPSELRDRPQWVVWRYTPRGEGKWAKPPFDPRTGRPADATDPATWATFGVALARLRSGRGNYDGLGFVFAAGDPFAGVDLDDCRDPQTGRIEPWAEAIIARLDTYAEVSPSGTGVKLFAAGSLPGPGLKAGKVEVYGDARYFTVTGQPLPDAPGTPQERQEAMADLYGTLKTGRPPRAAGGPSLALYAPADVGDDEAIARAVACPSSGAKFARLWAGDLSGYETASEADLALCNFLAFWCGGPDAGRIDGMFRSSGLMRDKWDRPTAGSTYGALTVARALEGRTEYYRPRPPSSPTRPPTCGSSLRPLCCTADPSAPSVSSVLHEGGDDWGNDPAIGEAIARTMPTGKSDSVRRKKVFAFARRLKAIPRTRDVELARLKPLVERWHDSALLLTGPVTFVTTWTDFVVAWPLVKVPAGSGTFERLWAESATAGRPPAARQYDDPNLCRLVTLCSLLQRNAGGLPFFLDCRSVSSLLGIHHTTVWRWLTKLLIADGVLEKASQGNWARARANEYRFVADAKGGRR